MRRLSFFILSLGFLGCSDPDFNQPELLKLPRILAVQAEPPQPSYGTATTLRALIYQPDVRADAGECAGANSSPQYQWEWCPLPTHSSDGFACPVNQAQLDALFVALGLGPAPLLDLGSGETATLTNPFPAPLLYGLCTGDIPIDPRLVGLEDLPAVGNAGVALACDMPNLSDPDPKHPLGFPVTVRLKYTPPCGSPHQEKYGDTLTAVFTVHLPTDDTIPPNQNPVVRTIFALSNYTPVDAGATGTPAALDAGAIDSGTTSEPIDAGEAIDAGLPIDAGEAIDAGLPIDAGEAIDAGLPIDAGEIIDGGSPSPDAPWGTPDVALPPPQAGSLPLDLALLPRQKRVRLWIDMAQGSAEFLVRTGTLDEIEAAKDGNQAKVLHFERLALQWFAEAGDFGGGHGNFGRRTGFQSTPNQTSLGPDDLEALERARQVDWALPLYEDYSKPQARVVVVIRDSRGGVAWAWATPTLEDHP